MLVNEEQVELGTRTDMMDTDAAITEATKEMGIAELKEKQREHRTSYKYQSCWIRLPSSLHGV